MAIYYQYSTLELPITNNDKIKYISNEPSSHQGIQLTMRPENGSVGLVVADKHARTETLESGLDRIV